MKALWSWILRLFGKGPKASKTPSKPLGGTTAPPPPPPPLKSPPTEIPPISVLQTGDLPVVTVVTNSGGQPAPNPSPAPPVAPDSGRPDPPVPAPVEPPEPVPVVVPPPPVPPAIPDSGVLPGSPTGPQGKSPTFFDDFSAGHLDTSKWIPSNWPAPGKIAGVHQGFFRPDHLYFGNGCLCIQLTQTKAADGSITSQGGEIQSRQTFGFGTYEWILRASSTSPTPEGSGKPVSGQISSGFIFQQDNGYTEIDCPEIEGDKPNQLSWTSWVDSKTRGYTATQSPEDPAAGFHSYKIHWTHDMIAFYVDNDVVAMHHTHIPQNPAFAMINHWGTNSTGWGGTATPGVDRYMFVRRFSFTPA